MVDYSMCCQTVTVYRETANGVLRTVVPGCFFQWREERAMEQIGPCKERKFLLVQPGAEQLVFPGDRVYDGVGPEMTVQAWAHFLPEQVDGLGEVAYATPYHWEGQYCHTEAGRK